MKWDDLLGDSARMIKKIALDQNLSRKEVQNYCGLVLQYLVDNARNLPARQDVSESLEKVMDDLKDEIGEGMITARDLLREHDMERGMQQGKQESARNIAKALLKQGLTESAIVEATGLSCNEVRQLSEDN